MKGRRANHRIRLLLAVFALMFAVAIARAAWVQGVQHNRFAAMARLMPALPLIGGDHL